MSKLNTRHIYTSESVSEGHPDKVCDQISDAILDACLEQDKYAHVGCETAVGPNLVVNLGEITCRNWNKINPQLIARQVVKDIGYDDPSEGFSWDTFNYVTSIHGQSADINQGVCRERVEDQGAGDQGMMFGYASYATPQMMPAPIYFSHILLEELTRLRKEKAIEYLRPDSKSQVSVLHDDGKAVKITTVVISHQTRDVPLKRIRKDLIEVAHQVLDKTGMLTNKTEFFINPTGKFVIGGPCGDSGVTGRKIIVILMAVWDRMAAALFPVKTPPRWIVPPLITPVTLPRILSRQDWPINAKFRLPMRLVLPSRSASMSAPMTQE